MRKGEKQVKKPLFRSGEKIPNTLLIWCCKFVGTADANGTHMAKPCASASGLGGGVGSLWASGGG